MSDYLVNSVMRGWQFLTGDVDYMTYGEKWYRQVGDTVYHVIELVNMHDATGETEQPVYHVNLQQIDLSIADLDSALSCCGWIKDDVTDPRMLVDAVSSYGQYAPMGGNYDGNNYRKLLAEAKRESKRLTRDDDYHAQRLARPVNQLGSTACEFAQGDMMSAIIRGIASGDRSARIVGKMHGLKEEELDDIADDPRNQQLSFTCGGF